jgi:hypothetical protein
MEQSHSSGRARSLQKLGLMDDKQQSNCQNFGGGQKYSTGIFG